jgi:predicted RNase H-like HicB family nuclease
MTGSSILGSSPDRRLRRTQRAGNDLAGHRSRCQPAFAASGPLQAKVRQEELRWPNGEGRPTASSGGFAHFLSHRLGAGSILAAKEPPMLKIEVEQEEDGRWIVEVTALAGALAYGATEAEARSRAAALACRMIADLIEHGEKIPEEARELFALA